MSDTRLKLAEQNLAHLRASLAWEANRDEVRRRIKATRDLIRKIKTEVKS